MSHSDGFYVGQLVSRLVPPASGLALIHAHGCISDLLRYVVKSCNPRSLRLSRHPRCATWPMVFLGLAFQLDLAQMEE